MKGMKAGRPLKTWMVALCALLSLAGCAGKTAEKGGEGKPEAPPPQPVTLKLYQSGGYWTDQDFNELIAEPVKQKYPHITVEHVVNSNGLDKLVSAGEPVDFFVTWNGVMGTYKDLGYYMDITPLAKKHNFDLSRFDPGALDAIRAVSDNRNELYALPYAVNLNAIYYNKSIFDKFGVPYPKDGMTWEETVEVARKVTRQDGSTQYFGLDTDDFVRFTFPLSLGTIDARTHKALVNSEPYKRAFETAKQFYSIPGMAYKTGGIDRFLKDKTVAMIATINLFLRLRQTPDLDWDVAQFPSYPDRPNVYGMYDLHIMIPNKNSKHQDEMMKVFEVLFSDEVQMIMTGKSAKVSTLKDPKYKQNFGKDLPELQGKRIDSVFKSVPAPAPEYSRFYSTAVGFLRNNYVDFINNKKDVNTALRDAEEQINQYVAAQLGK
jgi:multiple sugar transport system substrate-binding protein